MNITAALALSKLPIARQKSLIDGANQQMLPSSYFIYVKRS